MTIVSFHYYHIFKTDIKFVRIQKCLAQLHFVQLLNNVLLKNKVKTETMLGKNQSLNSQNCYSSILHKFYT